MQVEKDMEGTVWWATSELRWVRQPRGHMRLQQRWHGSASREKWIDVPIVAVDEMPQQAS